MPPRVEGTNVMALNPTEAKPSFGASLKQSWANTFAKSTALGVLRVLASLTVLGAAVDLAVSGIAHWRGTLGKNAQPETPSRVGSNAVGQDKSPFPKISNAAELFEFMFTLSEKKKVGRTVEVDGPKVRRIDPQTQVQTENKLYTYEGIVFRGDSRTPQTIVEQSGGLKSKNDLRNPANMLEAQGLGLGIGATGQSGVSCSKELYGVLPYCDSGQRDGYVYIIDTSKLGNTERAYDMAGISMGNGHKTVDETGGEVNITNIPESAIIGWIHIPNAETVRAKAEEAHEDFDAYLLRTLQPEQVHYNPVYGLTT